MRRWPLLDAAVSLGEHLTSRPCLGSDTDAATRAWQAAVHDGIWKVARREEIQDDSRYCRDFCINACDELFNLDDCSRCTESEKYKCYPGAPGWRGAKVEL